MLHIIKTGSSRTIIIMVLGLLLGEVFIGILYVIRFQLGIYAISGVLLYEHARSTAMNCS